MGRLVEVTGTSLIVETVEIPIGSDAWFTWLSTIKAFRYSDNPYHSITVRNRNKNYWFAYRTVNKVQRQLYVSKTDELDYERLQNILVDMNLEQIEYDKNRELEKEERAKQQQLKPENRVKELEQELEYLRTEIIDIADKNINGTHSYISKNGSTALRRIRELADRYRE